MNITNLKERYNKIPVGVRHFLLKALLLLVLWKALYYFVLFPTHIPDRWITDITTIAVAKLLHLFSGQVITILWSGTRDNIYINNNFLVGIAYDCNGLEEFELYIAILICLPTKWKRTLLYYVMGILGIYVLNVLRCAGLGWMKYIDNPLMDVAHHYAFKLVIYSFIFILWVWYSKKYAPAKL